MLRPVLLAALGFLIAGPVSAQSRIKDVATVEGVRENALTGYGLVVGLSGTGDSPAFPATAQTLRDMLNRQGVVADPVIRSRGAAAVSVSAALPPFARPGTTIDVSVAVLGDAGSLQGGILQLTALVGPDGQVYAVAQGPVSIAGGFSAGGSAQSVQRGVVSTARIPGGAIVERVPAFDLGRQATLTVVLRNPDFSLARQVAQAINTAMRANIARMLDNTGIEVTVPASYAGRAAELVADVENLPVRPDASPPPARIVLDERSGTIVMGESVRMSTVAVAHGNLQVRVTETPQVSQPGPFTQGGAAVVVPRTNVEVTPWGTRLVTLPAGSSIHELVNILNSINVGVQDQMAILQAIKQAGAIQADVIMGR
ncbi:MAG: flagellar basal body P-ring protein FlgI [Alphaproteobacteria bacterium]|nr:flagellar basal body P-ring protein FlgI [Alphaproteobacteria bacterium]